MIPEGFVHRPVPTDPGAGGEEEEPEDRQAKTHAFALVHTEVGQGGDQVKQQSAGRD